MDQIWSHVLTALAGGIPSLFLWLKNRSLADSLRAEKAASEAKTIETAMRSLTTSVDELTSQIKAQGKQLDVAQKQEERCLGLLKGMHEEWKDLRKVMKI
jgi:chromosome segregation ATPase